MPDRQIPLRHPGRCKRCKQSIPAGKVAWWRRGYGVWHISCPGNEPSPATDSSAETQPTRNVPNSRGFHTVKFAFSDVVAVWRAIVDRDGNELARRIKVIVNRDTANGRSMLG